jgi:hypothetical protein
MVLKFLDFEFSWFLGSRVLRYLGIKISELKIDRFHGLEVSGLWDSNFQGFRESIFFGFS